MERIAIILSSKHGGSFAQLIAKEVGEDIKIISTHPSKEIGVEGAIEVTLLSEWIEQNINNYSSFIFIGAVGIAVRLIAPYINDKHSDPAVVCMDTNGQNVISLLSGHIGGANELTTRIAHIIGASPIITTRSDIEGLWALDTLDKKYNWSANACGTTMNNAISLFVNKEPIALLLEIRDKGTEYLESTCPSHVDIYYSFNEIDTTKYKLIIAVTPRQLNINETAILYYHPKVLHLGVGCRKECSIEGVAEYISNYIREVNLSAHSIASICSIELKKDEPLLPELSKFFSNVPINIYNSEQLADIEVPNPSEHVKSVTGVSSVSEATAICSSKYGELLIEKQKGVVTEGSHFTFALAIERDAIRRGHIEFVGAGPGDPDLVSVRGRKMLESADLILYAGSLVPVALTTCAKNGATVRSSASMNLEEQFAIMKEFYDKGKFIVRLHTGDPCIYGAIQEQMALMDNYQMSYHITPGISSFQAAAAALESQFTIPEKVQSIILTRGEGRTPVPEKEKLNLLARSQSTMCIFLSATVVENVQRDLLEHYPPTTPVAACYKLTWPDEKIYRGELKDLAKIVKENNLTLTTMIVVGEAIDNRKGLSRLYADEFKHIFRV